MNSLQDNENIPETSSVHENTNDMTGKVQKSADVPVTSAARTDQSPSPDTRANAKIASRESNGRTTSSANSSSSSDDDSDDHADLLACWKCEHRRQKVPVRYRCMQYHASTPIGRAHHELALHYIVTVGIRDVIQNYELFEPSYVQRLSRCASSSYDLQLRTSTDYERFKCSRYPNFATSASYRQLDFVGGWHQYTLSGYESRPTKGKTRQFK